MSAEHITSEWMSELFPGKITARRADKNAGEYREWDSDFLDFKAKVVCEECNNTWMSNIEAQHAKPVLTPLITGQQDIPIRLPEARSIALFAFKTAVVLDHAKRSREPFFNRTQRHEFRKKLGIPASVQMWLCAYAGNRKSGRFVPHYLQGQLPNAGHMEMYVCTFAIGHIAIQVVSAKVSGRGTFDPKPSFEGLAVPFWPVLQRDYVWPGNLALLSPDDFMSFANRWKSMSATLYF